MHLLKKGKKTGKVTESRKQLNGDRKKIEKENEQRHTKRAQTNSRTCLSTSTTSVFYTAGMCILSIF